MNNGIGARKQESDVVGNEHAAMPTTWTTLRHCKEKRQWPEAVLGSSQPTAGYVNFVNGSNPGPELCSLAWVFRREFHSPSIHVLLKNPVLSKQNK
jgi:hypothetical protein